MLRNVLAGAALLLAATGFVLVLFAGQCQAWPMAVWGSVLLALILAERWRYRHADQGDSDDWLATDEQFIDPETGKLTRVFYRPTTGERRYVVEEETEIGK